MPVPELRHGSAYRWPGFVAEMKPRGNGKSREPGECHGPPTPPERIVAGQAPSESGTSAGRPCGEANCDSASAPSSEVLEAEEECPEPASPVCYLREFFPVGVDFESRQGHP